MIDGVLDLHCRAHHSLHLVMDQLARLSDSILDEPVKGFGYRTIKEQLLHIIGTEQFWLGLIRGFKSPSWEDVQVDTIDDIRELIERIAGETQDYLIGTTFDNLTEPVVLDLPDGRLNTTPGWALIHVITHSFHHKGQIAAMCRCLGHPIRETDMVIGVKSPIGFPENRERNLIT